MKTAKDSLRASVTETSEHKREKSVEDAYNTDTYNVAETSEHHTAHQNQHELQDEELKLDILEESRTEC